MPLESLGLDDQDSGQSSSRALVRCLKAGGAAQWLAVGDWRLYTRVSTSTPPGEPLAHFVSDSESIISAVITPTGEVVVPFSLAEAYENYVFERWRTSGRMRALPPAALDLFYRVRRPIPRRVQVSARRALIRWQGPPTFPTWPFDVSVASLLRFTIRCALVSRRRDALPFSWFWPEGATGAAILTHDVESAAGLQNAIAVADVEQERKLRSSFNIVGDWYRIDWGIVAELRARGFEIGVHGLYHDRSLFSSRREFERQLPLLKAVAQRLAAEGFRSPATHRVNEWLAELPFSYDCTIPLSDPYEPQPGGCCSPWPFFIGELVELPYTLPQDYTLFTLLGARTSTPWTQQVRRLECSYGLVQCIAHPDPGYLAEPRHRVRYAELLDFLVDRGSLWITLPREVARWWRERDSARGDPSNHQIGWARLDHEANVQLDPPRVPPRNATG
jgi:peptidoglycan/xylan/chitin deacetylase (PgdA/CDA1 family)